jgi:hypothetical protein
MPAVEGGPATIRPARVHEIKHDCYRLMVRRDGSRVRCFTRGGYDWADRFPAIVDAALRIKATSFLIDGEVVIARDGALGNSLANRITLPLLELEKRWLFRRLARELPR